MSMTRRGRRRGRPAGAAFLGPVQADARRQLGNANFGGASARLGKVTRQAVFQSLLEVAACGALHHAKVVVDDVVPAEFIAFVQQFSL